MKKESLSKRLASRQIKYTVLTALILGAFVACIQVYLDFSDQLKSFDRRVQQIINTSKMSASHAAFLLNATEAKAVAQGILEHNEIIGVQISDDSGEQLIQLSRPKVQHLYRWWANLIFESSRRYVVALTGASQPDHVIGKMVITTDPQADNKDFIERSMITFFSMLVMSLLLALVLSSLFALFLTKPLLKMIEDMAAIDPKSPSAMSIMIPQGHTDDELSILATVTNDLLKNIRNNLLALSNSNQNLEVQVLSRTHELQNEKQRLGNIIEGTDVGTWEWNIQTGEVIFNERWAEIVGYTLEELAPISIDTWLGLTHPDDLKVSDELLEKNFTGEIDYYECETRMRHKNGEWVWVLDRGKVMSYTDDGKVLWMYGTHQDITDRKQQEKALNQLSTTFSAVSGEVFFSNVVKHLATTLGMDYAMIGELMGEKDRINVVGGYAKGQAMALPFQYDLADTPCKNVVGQSFCICPSGVQQQYPNDHLLAELGVDGYMGSPLFDSAGQALGIILLMHGEPIENPEVAESLFKIFSARVSVEIERRQAEEQVRKLSSAIEQTGESVIITNQQGIIEYANPAFTRVTGYSAEEAIGQTPRLLKSGNQDAAFYKAMWKTITDGEVWHGRVVDKRKNGSFYPAMLTISPIFNPSGDVVYFVGTQSDLSEIEDMEQRFHQAQKMEAIGTMVGGIAHNFNNMLAGMTGNLYLAKKRVGENPQVVEKLSKVEKLSHHAADMIQQLLTFAHKGIIQMKEMPLTPFVSETLKLLRVSVPENIALHQDICAEDLVIMGDGTQLHQILANLVSNARDALEGQDEPCITIRLESFQADDAFTEDHPDFETGAYAHLSVADNGTGIPEHQLEQLFEPFFTTKEQGEGTGLGLSMVYGAIKTHQGFVSVESIKGEGSSFHIYILYWKKKKLLLILHLRWSPPKVRAN